MKSNASQRGLAFIYAAAIFTSAFLLFQIQPMISKAILPWFGGTPAVWTTCLLFFQTVLFAGYAYAHFSNTWLTRKQQAFLHIAVIITALLLLRVLPAPSQQPHGDEEPIWAILQILTLTIGLPYFVLSATGPLLQAWFADSFPGRTPYRLYALSNAGSLLALVSFPFFFESLFDLKWQGNLWWGGFIFFGLLCGYTAWRVATSSFVEASSTEQANAPPTSNANEKSPAAIASTAPSFIHYFLWLILPAFATATLMATTNHVSTDVAVVPLLWVVPLALYLLTFIIAFDRPGWYRPTLIAVLTLIAIYATAFCYGNGFGETKLYHSGFSGRVLRSTAEMLQIPTTDDQGDVIGPAVKITFPIALAANFLALFGICYLFLGELARLKPPTKYLTAYYLMMSAGGALGGLAVSVIAPHVFKTVFEWQLTIIVATIVVICLILYALISRALGGNEETNGRPATRMVSWIALFVLLVPTAFLALDMIDFLQSSQQNVVFQHRNFFGTMTIREQDMDIPNLATYLLRNGTTVHGSQYRAEERRRDPTTYYSKVSGIGRVMEFYHTNRPPGGVRVADVGLGTGTLASYMEKGDFLTFYEINPAVIEMATSGNWFTYTTDCRARGAHCDIKLGDARLTLEHEVNEKNLPRYHVLVLDAFSGDAVPTHLLTAEAYTTYLARLATEATDGAEGALVIHVSNRYLDLVRVVRAAAEKIGLKYVEVHNPKVPELMTYPADWMILTRNEALLAALQPFAYQPDPATAARPPVLWTDARSSLFEIVR